MKRIGAITATRSFILKVQIAFKWLERDSPLSDISLATSGRTAECRQKIGNHEPVLWSQVRWYWKEYCIVHISLAVHIK